MRSAFFPKGACGRAPLRLRCRPLTPLETKLVRQRNRVADALGDARVLVDETLRGLA